MSFSFDSFMKKVSAEKASGVSHVEEISDEKTSGVYHVKEISGEKTSGVSHVEEISGEKTSGVYHLEAETKFQARVDKFSFGWTVSNMNLIFERSHRSPFFHAQDGKVKWALNLTLRTDCIIVDLNLVESEEKHYAVKYELYAFNNNKEMIKSLVRLADINKMSSNPIDCLSICKEELNIKNGEDNLRILCIMEVSSVEAIEKLDSSAKIAPVVPSAVKQTVRSADKVNASTNVASAVPSTLQQLSTFNVPKDNANAVASLAQQSTVPLEISNAINFSVLTHSLPTSQSPVQQVSKNSVPSVVTFVVNGTLFEADRAKIVANCPSLIKGDEKQIKIDLKPEIFKQFLNFVLTKEANVAEFAADLLPPANFYEFQELKDLCEETLCCKVTEENCIELIILAELHSASKLKKEMMRYIAANASKLTDTPEWNKLKLSHKSLFDQVVLSIINCT